MTSGFDDRPGSTDNPYPYARVGSAGLMPPPVQPESGVSGSANNKPESSKGRRGLIVLCCVLVLVLVCALGAGFWFYRKQQTENAAWQAAHQYQSVLVEVNGEGFDAGKSSFVPLRVKGEDLDKKKVDKRLKFFPGKTELKLLAGRYQLALEASPIQDDGRIFSIPEDSVSLQVSVPTKKSANNKQAKQTAKPENTGKTTGNNTQSSTSKTVFKLTPVSPENVSDEQIAQLKKIYKEYGMDNAQIEQCVKKVTTAREAKKAEIAKAKAEAEKAKKAEEAKKQAEQARKAGPFTERQILDATYRHYKAFPEATGPDAPPVDAHLAGCIPEIKGDICVRVFWDYPDGHTSIARYYGIDSKTGKGYWDHYAAGMGPFTPVDITPYIY